ncbi:MAG: hypothetical protein V2I65_20450 [Paracoccaceae bacterium]|nr:hypothetical protein [Paracoccaceae bacterium]
MTAPSAAPSGALRAAAASHRARHGTCAGPPRPLPVWRHLDRVSGWLDRARSFCRAPPPEAIEVGSRGDAGGARPRTDAGRTARFPTDGSTRHVRIGRDPARSVAEG